MKSRDWYDFLWYVSQNIKINYALLASAINQHGPWKGQNIIVDKTWYLKSMEEKILSIDFKIAKADVERFLKPHEYQTLELWSAPFFIDRLQKLTNYL